MIGGGEHSGASDSRQLADELCITLKHALGIRRPAPRRNPVPSEIQEAVTATAAACLPQTSATAAIRPGRSYPLSVSHPEDAQGFNEHEELSESRAAYLQRNPSVNAFVLDKALSDCYGRFVALLPEDVLRDHVHLCFYLQEAHWWYSDKWAMRYPEKLLPMKFGAFLSLVSEDCMLLRSFITPQERAKLLSSWRDYSRQIPLRGGIMLNQTCDKVLLVQSYQSSHWTFPRGKTDESEEDSSCAAREIMEEVGLDVRKLIHPKSFLECEIDGRSVKLFLIPGVNEKDAVHPKSDYEIKHIRWVPLTLLSDMVNNRTPNFVTYHVKHFLKGLWTFVQEFRKGGLRTIFPEEYENFLRLSSNSVTGALQPSMTFRSSPPTSVASGGNRRPNLQQLHLPRNRSTGNLRKQYVDCRETFGESSGWSPDEMFRVNREKFGVESTYNENEDPTTAPKHKQTRDLIPFEAE